MTFRLGTGSRRELEGVHPDLVRVVERAIEITEVDFSVHDGLRTFAEQKEYVRTGASHTMKSKHLLGHAVDLVPYINGRLRWEWPPILKIAEAMRQAAEELNVAIVWGACWERLDNDTRSPKRMMDEYADKRHRQGEKPFLDGPHYQLA